MIYNKVMNNMIMILLGGENKKLAVSIGVDEDFVHPKMFVIPSKSTHGLLLYDRY